MDHRATLDRYSSNLPGEPTRADGGGNCLSACIDHCRGVSMYSVRRVPAWPSTYSFPQGEMLAIFFFCLLIVLFSPFTISHDRTHLGADLVFALCRFVRSDTHCLQGSLTYSAQKNSHALDTRTGQCDPHFFLISLRDFRRDTLRLRFIIQSLGAFRRACHRYYMFLEFSQKDINFIGQNLHFQLKN